MKETHQPLTFIFPHIHHDYSWDVATSGSLWKYLITDNIVEPLIRLGGKSQYRPAVASSWQFSEDKKLIKIEVSKGHFFHDGTEITPQNVFESLKRVLKLKKTSHSDLSEAICAEDDCSGLSLDGNIITLKLNKVVNGILYNLATPEYGLVPQGYGKKDETFKKDNFNLSGPFQVRGFIKDEMILKKVEDHYLNSPNTVEEVKIKELTNFDESVKYFKENKNVVLVGSDYSSGLKLAKLEGKKYISAPSLTEFFLPNIDSKKLNTVEKRKALFSLIHEAKEKIQLNDNLGLKTGQIFTPDNFARLDDSVVNALYDSPLKGEESYKVIVFDWMAETPIVPMIKEELAKVGIKLNVEIVPVTRLKEVLTKKDYDLIYLYSGVSAYDPIIEFVYLFNHPLTAFSYKNDSAYALLNEVKEIVDREKYKKGLQNLHLTLLRDYRVLPVIHTKMIYLTNSQYTLDNLNHFDGGLPLWEWTIDKSN